MPNSKKEKQLKNRLRVILLAFIGIVAFVVSVATNIIGMSNAIRKAPDSSGMAGLSVRTGGTGSLKTTKETKVDDKGKIVEEDFLVNALPIINLVNNNWDRINANFSGFQLDEEGNAVFEDGYILYCNGKYVNYLVFDNTYEKEVVGHIKVGTDLKTIEEKLGTPTFRKKDCLGYKTREVYVFYYQDEIAVYPNRNISNKNLETLLKSYIDKTYGKARTYLLVDIRNSYPDFTIELDEETDTVILTSITRQMIVKLDSLGNVEAELYNGYKVANEDTQNYIDNKMFLTNEEDLIEIVENERVSGK